MPRFVVFSIGIVILSGLASVLSAAGREARPEPKPAFERPQPPAGPLEPDFAPTPRVELIAESGTTTIDGNLLVFHNISSGNMRLMFARRDIFAFACEPKGRGTTRSRFGQYTLSAGAQLPCIVKSGSYRYYTVSRRNGSIQRTRNELEVR